MSGIQALREKRAARAREVHELANKTGDWTTDDQARYDAGMAEVEALAGQIQRIDNANRLVAENALEGQVSERAERIARDGRSPQAAAFLAWMRNGVEGLTAEQAGIIRNTMSEGTNSQGGYTVATDVATSVLEALKAYGGMRAVANVIRTAKGNPISYPTSDGTSEVGEIIAENGSATGADPTFNAIGLPVYKYSSKIVAVPFELLQDSEVDIEAFVRNRLVTRLGRITNTHFTTGSGTGQPNGVATAAGSGKVGATGQTGGVIYDDLVDLIHSIDPAYRLLGKCKFMLHDSSVKVIRKLKDGQNRPLLIPGWDTDIPGVPGAQPDTILGYPVQINQDVATMAANAKSILFGDFSFYTIRDVMEMSMFRFTDSVYTSKGQVGFLAWLRSGGNFIDVGGAVKAYVNSAT